MESCPILVHSIILISFPFIATYYIYHSFDRSYIILYHLIPSFFTLSLIPWRYSINPNSLYSSIFPSFPYFLNVLLPYPIALVLPFALPHLCSPASTLHSSIPFFAPLLHHEPSMLNPTQLQLEIPAIYQPIQLSSNTIDRGLRVSNSQLQLISFVCDYLKQKQAQIPRRSKNTSHISRIIFSPLCVHMYLCFAVICGSQTWKMMLDSYFGAGEAGANELNE